MNPPPIKFDQEMSIPLKDLSDILLKNKTSEIFRTARKDTNYDTTTHLEIYCRKSPEDAKDFSVLVTLNLDYFDCKCGDKYYAKIIFYNKPANFVMQREINDSISNDYDAHNSFQCRFCYLNDILKPESKFIENETFTIQMKGILFFESSSEGRNPPTSLGQYLWDRDDRDFIICVRKKNELKKEVKIHKFVLASRSPVFDRMLQTEMKEKSEGKVEITDFDAETVKFAVEHFYDRDIPKSLDIDLLIDLLQFSEKYDIQDLKRKIEHYLILKLHPNNINQMINASIFSNSLKLKEICIESVLFYKNHKIPFEETNLNEDFLTELNQITADLSIKED